MTLDEFQNLLDIYGADPQNWPVAQQDQALLLIANDEDAAVLHQDALMMDSLLAGEEAPTPNPDVLTTLFEDVARYAEAESYRKDTTVFVPNSRSGSWGQRMMDAILRPIPVLGASATAGLAVGFWDSWMAPSQSAMQLAEIVYSAFPL